MSKRIALNAFDMTCVGHQAPGLWKHPRSRADEYNTIEYWTDVAQVLEKGLFDALFLADVVGYYSSGLELTRGSRFTATASPTRIFDTRETVPATPFTAGSERVIPVAGPGGGGVPAGT